MKAGDQFRWRSPHWKEVIVEYIKLTDFGVEVRCIKATPTTYIRTGWYTDWKVGSVVVLSSISSWEPIDKASDFKDIYDKLSSDEDSTSR
jgi:hypothetical protein